MIELASVWKSFGGTESLLRGVDLAIGAESVAVLGGPSGVGKTTLLRLLYGGLQPTLGSVRVEGATLARLGQSSLRRLRAGIGVVPQTLQLFEERSARDNLSYALAARGERRAVMAARVEDAIERYGLGAFVDRTMGDLSGGERQWTAVVRSLLVEPKMLLLDEPTAHLDDARTAALATAVERARAGGACALIVSGDPRLWCAAESNSWRFLQLDEGTLEEVTPARPTAMADNVVAFPARSAVGAAE